MMESWKLNELNDLSCGDVAIRVHKIRRELDQAASARARAGCDMYAAERKHEHAKEIFCEKMQDERDISSKLEQLESYLEQRLNKESLES
jgi:hypothetical protein